MKRAALAGLVVLALFFHGEAEAKGKGSSSTKSSSSSTKSTSSTKSVSTSAASRSSTTSVKGHVTKQGTYVAPHKRTAPNSTQRDNWSTKGNTNPYTGKNGTKTPTK